MRLLPQSAGPAAAGARHAPPVFRTAPFRLFSSDGYFRFLCVCLAGYALAGKGFAYVGLPPLLIGEIMLILGVVVFLRSGCWFALGSAVPIVILTVLIVWVLCRTVVFLPIHGFDAPRDSVVVVYGIYALAVAALLVEKPERLGWVVAVYAPFAGLYAIVAPAILNVSMVFPNFPTWPGLGVPTIYVRLGEAAVHLSGTLVFVILGFRRVSYWWCGFLLLSLVFITPSRGAMLSVVVPAALAIVVSGRLRLIAMPMLAAFLVFLAAYAAGIEIPLSDGRSIGPGQIVRNFESLLGYSDAANLDGTKQWRLRWWKAIEGYTLHGPYFWTGKGFGVSLAVDDGFMVGQELGGPPLRSPHNVHYTMLARAGVPGVVLWFAAEGAWFLMMISAFLSARRRGETVWANLLLWILCYGLAIIIDATFDVAIEGPMVGIWHWSIFGLGVGAVMIYRAPRAPPRPCDPLGLSPYRRRGA
ncbi:O-antigen ligase family protein [Methylobacterium sp. ID0610]|uniref:O-antigen ligase family protein n=1 Tax=Methylobacterium carpenticola TaxID=3344827 RepID=UPI0036C2813F